MASNIVTGARERDKPPYGTARPAPDTDPSRPSRPSRSSQGGNRIGRSARAVWSSLSTDFKVFFSRPIELIREKRYRAIPASLICVLGIGVLGLLQHNDACWTVIKAIAGVRQLEPLWEVMAQLPLSMFAPAPDLPVWGALTQVLIAFGIAECWIGWRRMLGIAACTSALTSLAARAMAAISGSLNIGTPEVDKYQLDTGPSVAVVALLVYLALRLRTYWIVAATAVTMGGEAAILPNLAGREHLVAISLGFLSYFLLDKAWPASQRRWRARHGGVSPGV